MSLWRPFSRDAYYILVDSKPPEFVDLTQPTTTFCTAFVDTPSSIYGVKESALPWFKEYKECKPLEESISVAQQLNDLIKKENFFDLLVFVMSATFENIDKNGLAMLKGAEQEQ